MSLKLYGYDGNAFDQNSIRATKDRMLEAIYQVVLGGTYPSGGEPLDFTNGGGTPTLPNCIPPGVRGVAHIHLDGRSATSGFLNGGGYGCIVPPNLNAPLKLADLASLKLKLFAAGGSEASGTYASLGFANDVVILRVLYVI